MCVCVYVDICVSVVLCSVGVVSCDVVCVSIIIKNIIYNDANDINITSFIYTYTHIPCLNFLCTHLIKHMRVWTMPYNIQE